MSDETYSIADVIQRQPGYVVSLGDLCVCRMRNGVYHVVIPKGGELTEEEFKSAFEAAEFFLAKKRELCLGFSAITH